MFGGTEGEIVGDADASDLHSSIMTASSSRTTQSIGQKVGVADAVSPHAQRGECHQTPANRSPVKSGDEVPVVVQTQRSDPMDVSC